MIRRPLPRTASVPGGLPLAAALFAGLLLAPGACTERSTDGGTPTPSPVCTDCNTASPTATPVPTPTPCTDADNDGFCAALDCDDTNPLQHPDMLEDCDNSLDDECDGQVDCDDGDCVQDKACRITEEPDCTDGIDGDADGLGDCEDPDCAPFDCAGLCRCAGVCVTAEVCDDAGLVDEDCDGDSNCADMDCCQDPFCDPNSGGCAASPQDCSAPGFCPPPVELCTDGVDNDGDGNVDCADDDCWFEPVCVSSVCDGNNTVADGGFESAGPAWSGSSSSGGDWIVDSTNHAAHGGVMQGKLGGAGGDTSVISRQVTVPLGASSAGLSYWFDIESAETPGVGQRDTGSFTLLDDSGTVVLVVPHTFSNEDPTGGWTQRNVDVTSYSGQVLTLRWELFNSASLPTTVWLDDVELRCSR